MSEDLAVLNKKAIAAAHKYMGEVAWFTVIFTLAVVVGFIVNLALYVQGITPTWAAMLILGALVYASYTPLHEAAHRNINGHNESLTWLNDLCGYLVAPIIAIPYASHRLEHFTHHRYTNVPDKDPDFVISGLGKGFLMALLTAFKFIWIQNTFFIFNHWGNASSKEKIIFCMELTFSIAWRVVLIMVSSQPETWLVVVGGGFMGGFFTAYWFAYRPHIPYKESQRYRNTNSLIMPAWMKPLEWIWLGQNLHSVHHLFPRVPFYKYHALHREIEPILRAHGTPIVGIFSRKAI